ncbi:hypothetical protein PsYK624_122480 [Phanerochaete sordida]|uniref:Uncharacterized protein n=1 Tax=Phanerochaete sordida TaxID=48140 RepID=A0A9P3LI69_9APHY|nr:hypothetical protein PsYK624_122480 [Phanerochaete sordida]
MEHLWSIIRLVTHPAGVLADFCRFCNSTPLAIPFVRRLTIVGQALEADAPYNLIDFGIIRELLSTFTSCKTLEVNDVAWSITSFDFSPPAVVSQLEELSVTDTEFTGTSSVVPAFALAYPNMRELIMLGNYWSHDVDLCTLRDPPLGSLTVIYFSYLTPFNADQLASIIGSSRTKVTFLHVTIHISSFGEGESYVV